MNWWPTRILFLLIGLVIVSATVALIRKRRMRDEYAVLWVCTGLVFLAAVLLPGNLVQGAAADLGMDWGAVFSLICVPLPGRDRAALLGGADAQHGAAIEPGTGDRPAAR